MRQTLFAFFLIASLVFCGNSQAQQKTIVETAIAAGNFNTLVTAVKAAGLVETLSGRTQLTVFAPTDEAFAKLNRTSLGTQRG